MGQPHLVRGGATQVADHLGVHPAEHRRQGLGHREHTVAQQQRALVDAALRIRLEPGRVGAGPAHRLAPDHQPAVLCGEHRRRHGRRAIEFQYHRYSAVGGQHCHRVGRTKINRQDLHEPPS